MVPWHSLAPVSPISLIETNLIFILCRNLTAVYIPFEVCLKEKMQKLHQSLESVPHLLNSCMFYHLCFFFFLKTFSPNDLDFLVAVVEKSVLFVTWTPWHYDCLRQANCQNTLQMRHVAWHPNAGVSACLLSDGGWFLPCGSQLHHKTYVTSESGEHTKRGTQF